MKEQEVLNALKNNTNYIVNITPESAEFGFNEWRIKAQDGEAKGQNWQTWSAAMYLYTVKCVEDRKTPFFDAIRQM